MNTGGAITGGSDACACPGAVSGDGGTASGDIGVGGGPDGFAIGGGPLDGGI